MKKPKFRFTACNVTKNGMTTTSRSVSDLPISKEQHREIEAWVTDQIKLYSALLEIMGFDPTTIRFEIALKQ